MTFYPSNLKDEVPLTEMEKRVRKPGLEKDPGLSFGDVKFAIPIRHPSVDVK